MPAEDGYSKIYQSKRDQVNRFIQPKKATGKSTRTLNSYSRVLREFFHKQFPDLEPEDIEVIHTEEYVAVLNDRDLSQNSIKKYLEVLSSFYLYAMKRPHFEGITGNPAAVVMEEISRIRRDRPDCATWESACKSINHTADPRDKTVQIVLAKTGARLLETLSIRNEDLMLDDGFIRLRNRKGGSRQSSQSTLRRSKQSNAISL